MHTQTRLTSRRATLVLAGVPLALYLVFGVLPIVIAGYFSLTDWDGVSSTVRVVGLDNFVTLAGDPEVHRAFFVTTVIAVAATVILTLIAIPLAVLLSHNDAVTRLYRSAMFFPLVLSTLVVGFLWQSILNTTGLLNALLGSLGMKHIIFLGE